MDIRPLRQVFNTPFTLRDRLGFAARLPWAYRLAAALPAFRIEFVALALLIEQLRGHPFAEVLRSDIIGPLGMTDTFITAGGPPKSDLLHGHITVEDKRFDVAIPGYRSTHLAAWFPPVRDANTDDSALLQGKLLKPSTLVQMK